MRSRVPFLALCAVAQCAFTLLAGCSGAADDDATGDDDVTLAGDDDSTAAGDDDSTVAGDDDSSGDDDASSTATPHPAPSGKPGAPIDVIFDQVGVAHVYASSNEDALWMQGYLQARDRMWQMDFNRRAARGQVAELLGEDWFSADAYYRALNFSELAEQTLASLEQNDPEMVGLLEAFASGVNAYLDAALAGVDGASISPQVAALGYIPAPWDVTDSLAIDKLLTYNLSSTTDIDLTIGLVSTALEPKVVEDLIRPQPVDHAVVVPGFYPEPGNDVKVTPPARQELGVSRSDFGKVKKAFQKMSPLFSGSNNWVVSGDHTATGFPMLANDTHEGVEAPSTYHQIHLNTVDRGGDLDVQGYQFPGGPFIALGNNEYAAWGVTNNYADVTDLYRETTRGNQVQFNSQWIDMVSRTEVIKVRAAGGTVADAESRSITLKTVPHHGPVLPQETTGVPGLTVSVRWTGSRPVSVVRAFYDLNRARNVDEFHAALEQYHVGGLNVVFADLEGDIAYAARTDIPVRAQLDPAYPPYSILPGTGGYEWTDGYLPDDQIPHVTNPEAGFVASANNDVSGNVQDNNVYNDKVFLSGTYDEGTRATRITDRLKEYIDANVPITMADMADIQKDNYSLLATHLVPYVLTAAENRPDLVTAADVKQALELLKAWDYHTDEDSGASLLFHAWFGFVFRDIFQDETITAIYDDLSKDDINMLMRPLVYFLDLTKDDISAIEAGEKAFPSVSGLDYFDDQTTTDRVETRDEMLLKSFQETVAWLVSSYGAVDTWTWSAHHTITFTDRSNAYLPSASTGPFPLDGGFYTVDVAEFRITRDGALVAPFDDQNSPSQRTIFSLEPDGIKVWDILPGGQSERPGDAHFNDQLADYIGDQYRVRPFYKAEVEAAQSGVMHIGTDGRVTGGDNYRGSH